MFAGLVCEAWPLNEEGPRSGVAHSWEPEPNGFQGSLCFNDRRESPAAYLIALSICDSISVL